jgi:Pyruvate/2-oxoacid:ferredoxin oxidoreductase gamma subunit
LTKSERLAKYTYCLYPAGDGGGGAKSTNNISIEIGSESGKFSFQYATPGTNPTALETAGTITCANVTFPDPTDEIVKMEFAVEATNWD